MAKKRSQTRTAQPRPGPFHRPLAALGRRPAPTGDGPQGGGPVARRGPPTLAAVAAAGPPDDEASLFLRAVRDARRLAPGDERLAAPPPEAPLQLADEAQVVAELQALVRGEGAFRMDPEMAGEEGYAGLAAGVSRQLLGRLQRGHFAYTHHLDLHGLTREAAHAAAARFVAQTRRQGERCVLIITGRGRSSPGGEAVLRQALPRWLSRAPIQPHVLAFCTARAVDGGPGAFYVLLRRSGVPPFVVQSP